MGKKKPFIDKKTAMVYHVVRRSQRDVGTEATAETLSDFVLMPSPENAVRATAAGSSSSSSSSSSSAVVGGVAATSIGVGREKKEKVALNFRDLEARVAAAGLLDPVVAGAAMALSSVSVVSNTLLLRRWSPRARH